MTTGVNTAIAGLHGTLVLQADGGYIYKSIANNITADTTDVFVYTVKDGDGDLSTTTLTISLANVTVSATDTDALVNEAGLPGSAAMRHRTARSSTVRSRLPAAPGRTPLP